ncbi:MAG: tRNA (guanine(46)-N(7))-methyltransferase TrmB [Paracoccaceae bacterium]
MSDMPKPPRDMRPAARPNAAWRNLYGRGKGKPLRQGQAEHMEHTLPRLSLPGVSWDFNPTREAIDLTAVFGDDRPVWLEIGFGGGEHLAALAAANPDIGFIGVEPFLNGMAALLPRVAALENIRLHLGDGRDVMDVLPDASIARAFLLYPDPWPKKRHHGRRFVKAENIDPMARVLMAGGQFHIASDIADYVRHTQDYMASRRDFTGGEVMLEPWEGWHSTRYEQKALRAGRIPHYMTYIRADHA